MNLLHSFSFVWVEFIVLQSKLVQICFIAFTALAWSKNDFHLRNIPGHFYKLCVLFTDICNLRKRMVNNQRFRLFFAHIACPTVVLFGNTQVHKGFGFFDTFNCMKFFCEKIQQMSFISANDLNVQVITPRE